MRHLSDVGAKRNEEIIFGSGLGRNSGPGADKLYRRSVQHQSTSVRRADVSSRVVV
jgi:hypothetical protein